MTFKTVSRQLAQCLIVMIYDRTTQLFVSCVYTVLSCKNEDMYIPVLREIVVLTKYHWMAVSKTVDCKKRPKYSRWFLKKKPTMRLTLYISNSVKSCQVSSFWSYFSKTWLKNYDSRLWNIKNR
ncbi:hypothetical protein HZS_1897 [Henneguya salminicola]|nr:hypothetical protein HZS_1897 [Henneguya salminicola]